jgi:hypothetical protein
VGQAWGECALLAVASGRRGGVCRPQAPRSASAGRGKLGVVPIVRVARRAHARFGRFIGNRLDPDKAALQAPECSAFTINHGSSVPRSRCVNRRPGFDSRAIHR